MNKRSVQQTKSIEQKMCDYFKEKELYYKDINIAKSLYVYKILHLFLSEGANVNKNIIFEMLSLIRSVISNIIRNKVIFYNSKLIKNFNPQIVAKDIDIVIEIGSSVNDERCFPILKNLVSKMNRQKLIIITDHSDSDIRKI